MNPYEILGLKPGDSIEIIGKKYKELAKKFHPDSNRSFDTTEDFKKIQEAYEKLQDESFRGYYERIERVKQDKIKQAAEVKQASSTSIPKTGMTKPNAGRVEVNSNSLGPFIVIVILIVICFFVWLPIILPSNGNTSSNLVSSSTGSLSSNIDKQQKVLAEESKKYMDDLKSVVSLEGDESPVIARVNDVEKLKVTNPEFYKNLKVGDIVYIYSARIILYRPSEKKIINIAPIPTKIKVASDGQFTNLEAPTAKVTQEQLNAIMTLTSLTFGNKDAKLKFVEFIDPSCPYCHVASGGNTDYQTDRFLPVEKGGTYVPPVPEMKKLVHEGKASMTIVFTVGHGAGEVAMQGWYCANEKGKFWEVHDKSLTKEGYALINDVVKNSLENAPKFAEFTKDIVDPDFMTECIKSGKYASKITEGQQIASTFGVRGTPEFFIGTTPFNGAYSWTDMKSAADSLL